MEFIKVHIGGVTIKCQMTTYMLHAHKNKTRYCQQNFSDNYYHINHLSANTTGPDK